jgi:outer membrane murein-binding lipoprotein Lpp
MREAIIKLFKEVLMKKTILTGMVLILMLFLLSSCGVPQEDYDRVSSDLAAAQTEIQSLQGDLTAVRADLTKAEGDLAAAQDDLTKAQAQIQSLQGDKEATEEKRAEALAYAEFVDILMWPALVASEITPRFAFENAVEWLVELKNRASDLGDTKLSNYVKELDEPATFSAISDYCLDRVEQALK